MSQIHIISWVAADWSTILVATTALIGSFSLFIKALEGLVSALVTLFPSLKTADGRLVALAAWLDALAKSAWLNTAAASPRAPK